MTRIFLLGSDQPLLKAQKKTPGIFWSLSSTRIKSETKTSHQLKGLRIGCVKSNHAISLAIPPVATNARSTGTIWVGTPFWLAFKENQKESTHLGPFRVGGQCSMYLLLSHAYCGWTPVGMDATLMVGQITYELVQNLSTGSMAIRRKPTKNGSN